MCLLAARHAVGASQSTSRARVGEGHVAEHGPQPPASSPWWWRRWRQGRPQIGAQIAKPQPQPRSWKGQVSPPEPRHWEGQVSHPARPLSLPSPPEGNYRRRGEPGAAARCADPEGACLPREKKGRKESSFGCKGSCKGSGPKKEGWRRNVRVVRVRHRDRGRSGGRKSQAGSAGGFRQKKGAPQRSQTQSGPRAREASVHGCWLVFGREKEGIGFGQPLGGSGSWPASNVWLLNLLATLSRGEGLGWLQPSLATVPATQPRLWLFGDDEVFVPCVSDAWLGTAMQGAQGLTKKGVQLGVEVLTLWIMPGHANSKPIIF